MILNNPTWDRVNVEAVIHQQRRLRQSRQRLRRDQNIRYDQGSPRAVEAPNGESICWRKDRNPNNPVPGDWSGWSRIPSPPGQTAETDL